MVSLIAVAHIEKVLLIFPAALMSPADAQEERFKAL